MGSRTKLRRSRCDVRYSYSRTDIMTPFTPASLHRQQKNRNRKMQEGTVLSYTVIHTNSHPLAIGLIQLDDGSKILCQLQTTNYKLQIIEIGQGVQPRISLMEV